MPWNLVPLQKNLWYKKPLIWVGVAAIACLMLLVLPRVQARYRLWSERRGVGRAAQAYLRGDFKQAVVDARGVLKKNPHSAEATRVMAKSLEAMNSPNALSWRRELATMQAGDAENLLGLATACVKTRDFAGAARALNQLKSEDQKSARYHALAATIARQNRDTAAAESHGLEAVRLEPGNDEYRVQLAAVQLDSRVPETRAAALALLEKMTTNPAQHLVAVRTLLADATSHGERSRIQQWATTLASDPAAEFADKLARLGVLRSARDPQYSAYLAELQELAARDADNAYKLISWMNENNLALAVLDWESKLAPEFIAQPVSAALADAYARASDWKGLKAKVESATWTDMEFLRLAFLSRALERLDDASAANAAWSNALVTAQARPEWLEVLGKVAKAWGWKQRTEETLWKLAATGRCPRWAADFLWSTALAREDSAKLYEASKLLVKLDPTNFAPRNNYIFLALLTGQSADSPNELAATLYKQHPQQGVVASTYGYSLFQQGKAAEAVTVMESLPPEQLLTPQVVLYYAVFLAASGQTDRADEYFPRGEKALQLPEEKALVNFLSQACRARALERRGDTAGSDVAWKGALAAAEARPDWLEMLGRMTLDWKWQPQTETVVLKLAALERCPAWAAETLWNAALKTGDAAQINRAGRLITKVDPRSKSAAAVAAAGQSPAAPPPPVQPIDRSRRDTVQLFKESREAMLADPKNVTARGNYILLALLTGQSVDSARQLARALYKERPADATAAACYGLSLFQQGKAEEAVALMETLKPEQLREPVAALYYGHFLTGSEHAEKAAQFLDLAKDVPLLREEEALLHTAKQ